jgi:hypothetical protein
MFIYQTRKALSALVVFGIAATQVATVQADETLDQEDAQLAPADDSISPDTPQDIHEAPCNSGPPAPIYLKHRSGYDRCYGGTVGSFPVGHYVLEAATGGYFGRLITSRGVIYFYPGIRFTVDALVESVEITPPR